MIKKHITFKGLALVSEQTDMIFVDDNNVGPLFGHWIPRLAILELIHNSDGTVDITVSEETAKRLSFEREL